MYALFFRRGQCVAAVIAFLAGESAGAQPPAPLPLAANSAQVSKSRSPPLLDDESGAAPQKTISELLQFDPRASVFQRISVKGQVICQLDPEGFLMAGGNGMRFIAQKQTHLKRGDWVEVT